MPFTKIRPVPVRLRRPVYIRSNFRPPIGKKEKIFAVKVDGSDVIAGISLYENLFTDSRYDINFNNEKVHEVDIFVRQDILQFFSGESKDYKYLKFP